MTRNKWSILVLIIANMMPLTGVLLCGAKLSDILFLYWLENLIIGFYNVLKLIKISGSSYVNAARNFVPYFFGILLAQLILILMLFHPDAPYLQAVPGNIFSAVLPRLIKDATPWTFIFAGGFALSHGFSYWHNFLGKKEYERIDPEDQAAAPYKRVFVLAITVIVAGVCLEQVGSPIGGLVLMILLKTVLDIHSHNQEHPNVGDVSIGEDV